MSLSEAFAPIEAKYRDEILSHTWGHLAPKPYRKYKLTVDYALGAFGTFVILRYSTRLADSPWFCDALHYEFHKPGLTRGTIYSFRGRVSTNADCTKWKFEEDSE